MTHFVQVCDIIVLRLPHTICVSVCAFEVYMNKKIFLLHSLVTAHLVSLFVYKVKKQTLVFENMYVKSDLTLTQL